jgi:subtilisin family serine protease
MLRGVVFSILLLLPAAVFAAPAPASSSPSASASEWWLQTTLDADGDRIDDALAPQLALADPLVVLVAYDHLPTPRDRARLIDAGFELAQWYEHFDVVAVRALPADVPRLLQLPGVVFVERNDDIERHLKESVPLIGAPQVWKTYRATGKGIVVAVLDDGAFGQHPDLSPKLAGAFDAARPGGIGPLGAATAAVPIVPAGTEGHGTHVAGTIVGPGTQSGGTYKGVAPGAEFVDVKVFAGPNQTSSDIVLRGLDWVLSNRESLGIRVASMSLGGRASDGKDALSRAVNVAVDEGLVVVASAGNAGPAPGTIASPGAAEKAITVGAVDKQKRTAPYSSRGPLADGSIKPDVVAPGTAITSTVPPMTTPLSKVSSLLGGGGTSTLYYGALSGTSMAAPHVSGVVALMLEANPDLGPIEVKRILIATAQDMGAAGRDADTGYGFVNAIAATQVAEDPTLLDSPEFAAILGTLPEPEPEDLTTRAQVAFERAAREGKLPIYAALIGLPILAILIALGVRWMRR